MTYSQIELLWLKQFMSEIILYYMYTYERIFTVNRNHKQKLHEEK